ncbi:hypothetical protein QQX02_11400 [Demequina sp. EGI L300058]|uniref:Transcriptional regulator n=2 Tax=Demequina muriae TaxID=3051664 RepID=A0ABT8GJB5_9MICO|nr:hypothetical protein [Demequina sp. EGI L300058]
MSPADGVGQADSRQRVLRALCGFAVPVPLADVAAAVGLHANTVREHLDVLVEDGRVTTWHEHTGARGRPRALYRVTPAGLLAHEPGVDALRLAGIILEAFGQNESKARATAFAAGARWGEELAASLAGIDAPIDRLATALGAVGAEPSISAEAPGGVGCVHAARCPFRDLAAVRPDVVCGIHAAALERIANRPDQEDVLVTVRRATGREGGACMVELAWAADAPAPTSPHRP